MSQEYDDLIKQWWREAVQQSDGGFSIARYVANKACQWQQAKDAEICESRDYMEPHRYSVPTYKNAAQCAKAIREQGNE